MNVLHVVAHNNLLSCNRNILQTFGRITRKTLRPSFAKGQGTHKPRLAKKGQRSLKDLIQIKLICILKHLDNIILENRQHNNGGYLLTRLI